MKRIRIGLDPDSVQSAIDELERYKGWLKNKTDLLRQRVGMLIAWSASRGFSQAVADDVVKGETRYAEVDVSVAEDGNVTVVMATGEDAVFIEFGAGVYYNGPVGSSPHPKGGELGFTIGGYGKGYGAKEVWGFYDGGHLVLTHGTPASMPMYRGLKEVCDRIGEIAREVFSS